MAVEWQNGGSLLTARPHVDATQHNPKQVYYGRLPRFKLSTRGQRQAKEAATAIASSSHAHPHGLKALYASPMLRARQTARCVEQAHIGTFAAPLSVRLQASP